MKSIKYMDKNELHLQHSHTCMLTATVAARNQRTQPPQPPTAHNPHQTTSYSTENYKIIRAASRIQLPLTTQLKTINIFLFYTKPLIGIPPFTLKTQKTNTMTFHRNCCLHLQNSKLLQTLKNMSVEISNGNVVLRNNIKILLKYYSDKILLNYYFLELLPHTHVSIIDNNNKKTLMSWDMVRMVWR